MNALDGLPRDALSRLTREFSGEKILWAGRPSPRTAFWRSTPIWLFAIPWTAFSIGWESMALMAHFAESQKSEHAAGSIMAMIFPIFGLPFIIIGIGMMVAPFWAAWKAGRMVHILTEARLVTAVLGRDLSLTSFEPGRVVSLKRVEKADGSGTMTLSLGTYRDSDGDSAEKLETWYGVPAIRGLEDQLRDVMAQRRGA
jgi:hypothetical protein